MRLKTELHHWWPRNLSRFWAGDDGCTTQFSHDGEIVRAPPANFGAITNAHHIKFQDDNPWNTSFESTFGKADRQFGDLAEWLMKRETKQAGPRAVFHDRLLAQTLPPKRRRQLSECLASLIVRSPGSRNNIRMTVEYYRQRFGMKNFQADKSIIAANMRSCYDVFVRVIDAAGKFLVLITDAQEFICGDGFLHNFPSSGDRPLNPRCVVPLLPTITVLFVSPLIFRTHPELMTLRLGKEEVVFFNNIVQIYSRDHIFYRNDKPKIIDQFGEREFFQFEYHQEEWLDGLIEAAVTFGPGLSHRRAYRV